MTTSTLTRLLSTKEVAEILGRHEKTVLELARRGDLGCIRQNLRSVQYTEQHVHDYLAKCEVPAAEPAPKPAKPQRNPNRRYAS